MKFLWDKEIVWILQASYLQNFIIDNVGRCLSHSFMYRQSLLRVQTISQTQLCFFMNYLVSFLITFTLGECYHIMVAYSQFVSNFIVMHGSAGIAPIFFCGTISKHQDKI